MNEIKKIGLGGGCHWCTEAVFQSLKGVISVEQGFLAANNEFASFSEGVIVNFDPKIIELKLLIQIHLLTHKSTKNHSMRDKYRSAIYTFSNDQKNAATQILSELNKISVDNLITHVLNFQEFKSSPEAFTNYYFSNPEKPFCETFINPKLKLLLNDFSTAVDHEKLSHLKLESTF